MAETITANPSLPTTVSDDDTITNTVSRTDDNLDGDVNVTINQIGPAQKKDCDPCKPCCPTKEMFCADSGFSDLLHYGYHHNHKPVAADCCGGGDIYSPSPTVTVTKSVNNFNFGGAFVPAGYFNNQGGGQAATVVGGQQTIEEIANPCGCDGDSDSSSDSSSEVTHIVNRVYNDTNNVYNNTYDNTSGSTTGTTTTTFDTADPEGDTTSTVDGVDVTNTTTNTTSST